VLTVVAITGMARQADDDRVRQPLVYVGGMRRVRALTRLGSLFCLMSCAVFLWRQVLHEPTDMRRFIALYLIGLLFAIGARLLALRQVVATPGGWLLAPFIGRARPMPPVRGVFVRGEDVVAVAVDGKLIVLGIDRFPFRDPATIRRSLVRNLPRW
jgi:hypothetical protein